MHCSQPPTDFSLSPSYFAGNSNLKSHPRTIVETDKNIFPTLFATVPKYFYSNSQEAQANSKLKREDSFDFSIGFSEPSLGEEEEDMRPLECFGNLDIDSSMRFPSRKFETAQLSFEDPEPERIFFPKTQNKKKNSASFCENNQATPKRKASGETNPNSPKRKSVKHRFSRLPSLSTNPELRLEGGSQQENVTPFTLELLSDSSTEELITPPRPKSQKKTKFCVHEGCGRNARGSSGLCVRHGGGKRCSISGCESAARSFSEFCSHHGGGKRCKALNCQKGAVNKSDYCRKHEKTLMLNSGPFSLETQQLNIFSKPLEAAPLGGAFFDIESV